MNKLESLGSLDIKWQNIHNRPKSEESQVGYGAQTANYYLLPHFM